MKEIIQKAIEGRYFIPPMQLHDTFGKLELIYGLKPEYCVVLDPLFWQSLSKACLWERLVAMPSMPLSSHISLKTIPTDENWRMIALRFHEINLTEGWDKAVSWLEDLINNK